MKNTSMLQLIKCTTGCVILVFGSLLHGNQKHTQSDHKETDTNSWKMTDLFVVAMSLLSFSFLYTVGGVTFRCMWLLHGDTGCKATQTIASVTWQPANSESIVSSSAKKLISAQVLSMVLKLLLYSFSFIIYLSIAIKY